MTQPEALPRYPTAPPADRYGRRDPVRSRRNGLIAAGVMVALMLGFAVWMGVREARKPVYWDSNGFTAVDDGQARLTVFVTVDPGRTAVCTVQMFNAGLTEVGRLDVAVGPAAEPRIAKVVTVPTFEFATSGKVTDCTVP